jgi:DNA-3-methyladenine glycosylase II
MVTWNSSCAMPTFSIAPVPPFRLDFTAWALRRRPENEVDLWDGRCYRRVLTIDDRPTEVTVRQIGKPERARLCVTLQGSRITSHTKAVARSLLERMLGLRKDLTAFYQLAAQDPQFARLAEEFRGLKPPRFPSVFEAVVNGIACQQLSLLVGIHLLNRLTRRFGSPAMNSLRAFADPSRLASAKMPSLRKLGFNTNKSRELIELSNVIRDRQLDLEALAGFNNEAALETLLRINGVGRWTAEYVLLRGLGHLDTFPCDDVGARNNLAVFAGLRSPLSYEAVQKIVAAWRPYAGFLYFHLLMAKIREAGWLHLGNGNGS